MSGLLAQTLLMSRRVPEANLDQIPLGLESPFGLVRHEWLYGIAPKIIETLKPYYDDNVGYTVGREVSGGALSPPDPKVAVRQGGSPSHRRPCGIL